MNLWLVRHARTTAREGVCYGRTEVLADAAHTREIAAALHAQLPAPIPVRCSPAQRCRALADALQQYRPHLRTTFDPALREMDFGAWEGRLWDDIGREALATWMADFPRHRPGGGENVQSLLARVALALETERSRNEDALWLAHAGVIRAVRVLLQEKEVLSAADWPAGPVPFGAAEVVAL